MESSLGRTGGLGVSPIFSMSPKVWGTIRGFGCCFPLSKGDSRGLTQSNSHSKTKARCGYKRGCIGLYRYTRFTEALYS